MQLSLAATLLACTSTVQAFSDSSPFVLFSTAELPSLSDNAQLQTSGKVVETAAKLLSACPTERYILLSQPNIHAADIRDGARCGLPNLCRAIAAESTRGRFSVAEVIGQVSTKPLMESVTASCAKKGKVAQIQKVELAHLPRVRETAKRAEVLADNDHELGKLLDALEGEYTVVMFSDPNEFQVYEPEFIESVHKNHLDLRRAVEQPALAGARRASNTTRDTRPLFEKYQFFTPGIFSALIALFIILSILTVGIRALASLEVSYGAFDKENGPAAQKK
ncbi:BIG/ATPase V1 complex, subunit S1 [Schizothecium vesticola]|uniref:Protein BIG1 n=1 Tax=Schizothecium vesticola TaxID=314040 RepID=A0AA40FBG3_9PEZI|nr:BIG/ATPase V1 complex, subunit S1 [Schizothecium vesticola]